MKPIIIISPKFLNIVTFGFAIGITIWPFIIISENRVVTINHESIHIKQQQEMLVIPFYIWYYIEMLIRFLFINGRKAYLNVSFEREAYDNEYNLDYNKIRKPYSWVKYLKKK